MELERKIYPLELLDHEGGEDEPQFRGIASVMNKKDLHDDVIDSGAFTRTLKHKNNRVVLLEGHIPSDRLGVAVLEDKDPKIMVDGFMNLEKQMAVDTLSDMRFQKKHKVPLGLSIGFQTQKQDFIDGVRHIKELALWELSVVTFPANEGAKVTGVKVAVPFQNFKMADRERPWKVTDAEKRVRTWAGADDGLTSAAIWNKYKLCFVWWDSENPDKFSSYKLLIADIVDGKKVAVPRGIFAAAAVAQGSRGGLKVPAVDLPKIRAHLGRYYAKMDLTPPWEESNAADFNLDFVGAACYASELKRAGVAMDDTDHEIMRKATGSMIALFPSVNANGDSRKHSLYDEADPEGLSEEADQAAMGDYLELLRSMTP